MTQLTPDMHGASLTCKIESREITEGKICHNNGMYWICQNYKEGSPAPDMLGFRYSWSVTTGTAEALEKDDVTNIVLFGSESVDYTESLKKEQLVKGAIYVYDKTHVFRCSSPEDLRCDCYLDLRRKKYDTDGGSVRGGKITRATPGQQEHLRACIAAGKYAEPSGESTGETTSGFMDTKIWIGDNPQLRVKVLAKFKELGYKRADASGHGKAWALYVGLDSTVRNTEEHEEGGEKRTCFSDNKKREIFPQTLV